jgi:2-oxoglutarate dehydrogenase E1 component
MSDSRPAADLNSWLEEELASEYRHNRQMVDDEWRRVFDAVPANGAAKTNGAQAAPASATGPVAMTGPVAAPVIGPSTETDQFLPMRGVAAKIAENMNTSLLVPTATSQRVIPVKVMEENRQILNYYRGMTGSSKISFTHLIGWAIVKAIETNPMINHGYTQQGSEMVRISRTQVNLGLAVDVAGKDGNRSLVVPNIKGSEKLTFTGYLQAFDGLVQKARTGKLGLPDFAGTTVSLTNPGTVGTLGSVPRLMYGQGAIIATGAIDFPPEYQGVAPQVKAALGISKVMMMTCTYDHRIIQGAESGAFLGRVAALLQGEDGFYEAIFNDLKIAHPAFAFVPDNATAGTFMGGDAAKQAAVGQLIEAYRQYGHFLGELDPLGLERPEFHPDMDPANYGLGMWDLDREFPVGNYQLLDKKGRRRQTAPLREIIDALRQTYCGKFCVEYLHLRNPQERRWLQDRMEPTRNSWPLDKDLQARVLRRLVEAEEFETFLQTRFIGKKRFSAEGAESAIAALDEVIEQAVKAGAVEFVIGMAHRARLNVLANIAGKPFENIFAEFEGHVHPDSEGSGDVKYHLGFQGVRQTVAGPEVTVSVAFNPSHLEAVNPVVEGIVRPKQDRLGDAERKRVIPILVHGDAAFAGQGVVMETMNLSQVDGYTTGGTIHVVINNQIGFTTSPREARSSPYCTDVARMVESPVFHVNGDDPEAVVRAAQLAFEFRHTFQKDVVLDIVCYRRYGHNEGDEPTYTQPLMYRKIKDHQPVSKLYSARLAKDKLVSLEEYQAMKQQVVQGLSAAHERSQGLKLRHEPIELTAVSAEMAQGIRRQTAADPELLQHVLRVLTTPPQGWNVHTKLKAFLDKRREVLQGAPMDWAAAEALAFGTMVCEGTPVRLSGQDSGRGTFNQRLLQWYDTETGERYNPLRHLKLNQARFEVYNSTLSEFAVMGFELGFSIGDPLTLVLWEAQFGDFCNGAQIIIDQFLCSAETKWGQPNGLVLLLPHGYEGQGPEHSSARVERFLNLCAGDNMQVCNCTTPAQYFHLLRRQMYGGPDRRGVRKPLVIFTPKSLLRHPKATSVMAELTAGTFQPVIDDVREDVRRILICTGKVYYDLAAAREKDQRDDVAIIRTEQMYPFPEAELRAIFERHPEAEIFWVQEEPRNMGPWRFMFSHLQPLVFQSRRRVHFSGRSENASPATGFEKRHAYEQAELIRDAFMPLMSRHRNGRWALLEA